MVRAVLFKDGVDATGQVGSTSADGLMVMFTIVDHLAIVEGGELDIVESGNLGIEIKGGFNEVGAG